MGTSTSSTPALSAGRKYTPLLVGAGVIVLLAIMIWQAIASGGVPDPLAANQSERAVTLNISILVFREGLESILVLSAITASMTGKAHVYRRPITLGTAIAFVATIITWFGVVGLINDLTESIPALHVQAATGLLAIIVLLVVMNWFFHKVYWTGWISMHTKKKHSLLKSDDGSSESRSKVFWGLVVLGFTSLYREGFEVVLFLQSYRLQRGTEVVLGGVLFGMFFTAIVAVLTFIAHQKLPYKRMLIVTGVMLAIVLLVMVGEQVQEMQLAHWISTTPIPALEPKIPGWMGMWFAVFPNVEGLVLQALAATLVFGSYIVARWQVKRA